MGSSLLTMPWAFEKAGFAQTLVLMMACGLISCYTAVIVVRIAAKLVGKHELTQVSGDIGFYQYLYDIIGFFQKLVHIVYN